MRTAGDDLPLDEGASANGKLILAQLKSSVDGLRGPGEGR